MANVSGWNELINGSIVEASFVMYDTAFKNNLLMIMFVVFSSVLYAKTRNPALTFGLGMIFFVMFYETLRTSTLSVTVISLLLVLQLAMAIYEIFWGNQ